MSFVSNQFGLGIVLSMKNLISASAQAARKDLKDLGDMAVKTQSWVTKSSQQLADEQKEILKGYRAVGIAATAAGTAILGTMGYMAKQAADSETYMARVKINLLASGTAASLASIQVGSLFTEIENVSDALGTSKDDMEAAADALTQIVGFDLAKASLKSIGELAVATSESIATSAGAVSDALRVYAVRLGNVMTQEEKATYVSTILFNASKMSRLALGQFNEIMSQTSAEAASMGLSFEESAGTLAFMSKVGPSGRMLRSGIVAYYQGMRQAITKTVGTQSLWDVASGANANSPIAIAARLGVKFTDNEGKALSFYETLIQLEQHYGITAEKSAETQKKINAGLITGAQAAAAYGISAKDYADLELLYTQGAAEALVESAGRSDELKKIIDNIAKPEAFKEAVVTMSATTVHAFMAAKNAALSLADDLGGPLLGAAISFLKDIRSIVLTIKDWATTHPIIAKWAMYLAGAVGTILLVGGAVATITASILLMNLAMMATPIGWITLAITGLIAGIVLLVKNWDWLKDKTLWVWTQIRTAATAVFESLTNLITNSPIYKLFTWIFEMTDTGIHKVRSILGIREEAGISTVVSAQPQPDWNMYAPPDPKKAAAELQTMVRGEIRNAFDYSNRWITQNIGFKISGSSDMTKVVQNALAEAALRGGFGKELGW